MPNVSRVITCANIGPDGCVTPPIGSPFNGDLIFTCDSGCTIKVCDPNLVVNGTVTVNAPCHVIFTGNLIIHGTSEGIYEVLGSREIVD